MKQVWILNHYAQEPGGAGGTRHFHLSKYLKEHGWEATLIASSVDHGVGNQRLIDGESHAQKIFSNVRFLWIRTSVYVGNGSGRIRNMLEYSWRVLIKKNTAELPRPDAVIGSSVHPFAAVAGYLLARRYKVPFVFEVRDLWPQTLIDMGILKSTSLMAWLLRKLELWIYKRAARIVVLLPKAWEYIVPLGITKDKVIWIPNGVDLELFPRLVPAVASIKFSLMYFGSHGQANGLANLLAAMKIVQDSAGASHINLRLIGQGPLKKKLQLEAQALNLGNVTFEDAVPKNKIAALAAQADAFVISVLDLPGLYRYGISMNKLFDYLASERPIIIASAAANNPVKESGAGLTVPPNNPIALAAAILKLADTPLSVRQEMGSKGRIHVENNYSYDLLASKLAQTLNLVCAEQMRTK